MKKVLSMLLAVCMLAALLAACGDSGASGSTPAADGGSAANAPAGSPDGEREVVTFWYTHQGEEAAVMEQTIAAYNESQDRYLVEGLSVPDRQKIVVAVSGNEAPDVIECSSANVVDFYANGLLQSLQPYIDAEDPSVWDINDTAETCVNAMKLDGEQYGIGWDQEIIQMFYNKTLLKEAGYDAPPTTVDEMYEMAVAATTLDADGNIDVLGYPLFPLASARQELIYAFGGRFWAEDLTKLTPDDPKILDSLNMNVKYREQYGIDKVQAFIATANTNRYTENDMFFAGKQLFRIDGQWLPAMIKNFGSDVDWGVVLLPSATGDPDGRGTSRYETTGAAIPVNAVNKDGAWDFIKWLTSPEGQKIMCIGNSWLPANTTLYDDPDLNAMPCFKEFMNALVEGNFVYYSRHPESAQYNSLIEEHLDYVYTGAKTPEEAMADLAERAKTLG